MKEKMRYVITISICIITIVNAYGKSGPGQSAQPLTTAEMYRMIIQHGFYCEIIRGSGYHGEGLKGINVPQDYIFHGSRDVAAEIDNRLIKTTSLSMDKQLKSETIELWWHRKSKEYSFQEAKRKINALNQKSKDKKKIWRMPTIMEVLSIVSEKSPNRNLFPKEFKLPKKKDFILWTSTPVKKEGTFLEYEKDRKAYFVILGTYHKSNGEYSLSFGLKNIDNTMDKALLLPVFSDKVYAYKPLAVGTKNSKNNSPGIIPGFDDKTSSPATTAPQKKKAPSQKSPQRMAVDKIPGFDDTPTKPKYPPTPNFKTTRIKLKLVLIPHISGGMLNTSEYKLLEHINDWIEKDIKDIKTSLNRSFQINLTLQKLNPMNNRHLDTVNDLYFIMSKTGITDDELINQVNKRIMIPGKMDFVLTIKNSLDRRSGIETTKVSVIDGFHKRIYERINIQNQKEQRYDQLRGQVKNMINEVLYNYFH